MECYIYEIEYNAKLCIQEGKLLLWVPSKCVITTLHRLLYSLVQASRIGRSIHLFIGQDIFHGVCGLLIHGDFYYEIVPSAKELLWSSSRQSSLCKSCKYLFLEFHIILMAYQFLSQLTFGLEEQQHELKIMLDMKLIQCLPFMLVVKLRSSTRKS